jgi:hypothetical protein
LSDKNPIDLPLASPLFHLPARTGPKGALLKQLALVKESAVLNTEAKKYRLSKMQSLIVVVFWFYLFETLNIPTSS